jgi:hypothetical protein
MGNALYILHNINLQAKPGTSAIQRNFSSHIPTHISTLSLVHYYFTLSQMKHRLRFSVWLVQNAIPSNRSRTPIYGTFKWKQNLGNFKLFSLFSASSAEKFNTKSPIEIGDTTSSPT